ncbi:DUF547 domain-containing protein/Lzipper-MIP1 domain-containing protein [Cephalotus follicularis]|uniref:DUF547 domain-containing protein/Lzipper-MIP1 domain-containing protein n=1 Tax=Cephalotus follicularis TaxID=3775 RepID=A0A1Q3C1T1_CEPFO|nr:DUF547 domain-containing protein/Lzipper-MIP1 domain-containing protein [Cephalotus follicularis]
MLCLKAVAIDDDAELEHNQAAARNSSTGGGGGGANAFLLPLTLGTSIQRYLCKNGRVSSPSFSSGDATPISSLFQDAKLHNKKSGPKRSGNMCLYKYQLEEDVKKLQKELQEEINLRLVLANAIEHVSFSKSPWKLPVKTQELLDSIAVLEIHVSKLEQESIALQYQLSQERNERRLEQYRLKNLPYPGSSLFDCSLAYLTEQIMSNCSREEVEGKMDCLPSWMDVMEDQQIFYFVDKLWHHPNQLSEEMILCMRDIYLFLADSSTLSPSDCMDSSSSPRASLESYSDFPMMTSVEKSPSVDIEHASNIKHGSEVFARDSMLDPYRFPGKVDWTRNIGVYSIAAEVSWLSVGEKELEYAAGALKRFRFLVEQLTKVNLSCMSCNEKLAFWINLYNALIMHAYLAYGVPRSDIKLFSLMQKAAYTIGGQSLSAADIEYIILKMKPPAHCPQIALVVALQKFKVSEDRKKYSIDDIEPLLPFALSYGMHSSPAVRIFRPDNVKELLKKSLKDYAQASVGISDRGKLLVPKLLHCFAKGLVEESLLPEWICQYLSPEQAAMIRDCSSNHRWKLLGSRIFSILPFDSRFRFLFLLEDS